MSVGPAASGLDQRDSLVSPRKFMVDGQYLNEQQVRQYFDGGRLELADLTERERVALDMANVASPRGKLLDVGCYVGRFVKAVTMQYPGVEVWGVDADRDNVDIGRMLLPELAARLERRSVYDLEFASGSFDCVTLQEVLEHVYRPIDAVREINRVLRPGGYLVVTTPNANAAPWRLPFVHARRSLRRRLGKPRRMGNQLFYANMVWAPHVYAWTPVVLNTLFLTNGFEYVEHRFWGHSRWQKLLPDMSDGMAFLVRKVASPPQTMV
jgi:SAM-dependent methyltransferase